MDKTPIYEYPASYAREHNELPQYRASMDSLEKCKAAIDAAITGQWNGMGFPDDAAKGVLKEFGQEKVSLVLAYTIYEKEHDKRISGHNQDWAKTISKHSLRPGIPGITLESHPAKLDIFIDVARKNIQELEQEKTAERSGTRRASARRRAAKPVMPPVYKESYEYAYHHGESDQHIASNCANIACRDAIEKAIANYYRANTFDAVAAVRDVVKQFGYERMFYVLANTVQSMNHDGRISQSNNKWAQTIPIAFERGKRDVSYLITRSHPGILNMFVSEARHEFLLKQPLKAADIKAEASHILEQFRKAAEPNSPNGTHFMAQVSPDFWARAKQKDHDRLINMLPFASLSLSTLNDRKGIYALISKDEDRSKPLILRKPSVRKKLQELSSQPSASGQRIAKNQER